MINSTTVINLTAKKVTYQRTFNYLGNVFNIITTRTLLEYCKEDPSAAIALQEYGPILQSDKKPAALLIGTPSFTLQLFDSIDKESKIPTQ